MGFSVVDLGTASSISGATQVLYIPAGGVPAGATIVVVVGEDGASIGGSVTDAAGNTYASAASKLANNLSSNGQLNIFYAYNVAALASFNYIAFTKSVSGDRTGISCFYITGLETGNPLDSSVTATAAGSSGVAPTVTSGTPSTSSELFIAAVSEGQGSSTFTQDSSNGAWATPPSSITFGAIGSGVAGIYGGSLRASDKNAKTYAPTFSSPKVWAAAIIAFKVKPAGNMFLAF